jgi:hypothetical protein
MRVMAKTPSDPMLFDLISRAFANDQRALASEVAAASTEVDSSEHRKAAEDRELSAEAWRTVVKRYESLRWAAIPSGSEPQPKSGAVG